MKKLFFLLLILFTVPIFAQGFSFKKGTSTGLYTVTPKFKIHCVVDGDEIFRVTSDNKLIISPKYKKYEKQIKEYIKNIEAKKKGWKSV